MARKQALDWATHSQLHLAWVSTDHRRVKQLLFILREREHRIRSSPRSRFVTWQFPSLIVRNLTLRVSDHTRRLLSLFRLYSPYNLIHSIIFFLCSLPIWLRSPLNFRWCCWLERWLEVCKPCIDIISVKTFSCSSWAFHSLPPLPFSTAYLMLPTHIPPSPPVSSRYMTFSTVKTYI